VKTRRCLGGFLLAAVVSLASCTRARVQSATQPVVIPVRVAPVVVKDMPVTVHVIGTVQPYATVQVKPQVTGVLQQVHFRQGEFVRRGQLLFTIDPAPFETALAQAEATLARDRAQLHNAQVQAERYRKLWQEGIGTQQQYDDAQAQADSLAGLVRADEAAVAAARLQLSYCKIYSPMDGVTGDLLVNPGNVVVANNIPVLVTINQITPVYVDFSVPQDLLEQVRHALALRSRVLAYTGGDSARPETGFLSFVDNTVDTTTGSIHLKGTFPNPDHRLWPGRFVTVTLELAEEKNALVVPLPAVQTGQQGSYVWVIDEQGHAAMRSITVRRQVGEEAVVAGQLRPGERVVVDGQIRLTPGARVQIVGGA